MCKADSTTSMESDSTLCYDNSETNSGNDSLLSQPMLIEDTNETDDELQEWAVQALKLQQQAQPQIQMHTQCILVVTNVKMIKTTRYFFSFYLFLLCFCILN